MSDSDTKAALLKELWLRFQKLSLDENLAQNRWSQYSLPDKSSPFSAALEKLMAGKSVPEETSPDHSFPEDLSREESSFDNAQSDHASIDNALPESASPEKQPSEKNSSEKPLSEKTAPEQPSVKKLATKTKEQTAWFMCPYLDEHVRLQLAEDGIGYYTFNPDDDDDSATNSYSTNIMGKFACSNKRCRNTWRSLLVAITIRVYDDYQYNAKVYNQQCKDCEELGDPGVFKRSYVDRVSYRIKKWHGVKMGKYQRGEDIEPEGRHKSEFCEGCKKGLCKGRELRR